MQAAAAIDSFKIESPVKKINFNPADKENHPADEDSLAALAEQMDNQQKPVEAPVQVAKAAETKVEKEAPAAVAPGIKPEEADEPLLQENPQRFVLFPIKYHEVRDFP